jgi:hypothetical protein
MRCKQCGGKGAWESLGICAKCTAENTSKLVKEKVK